ncbi:hypothetical protein UT300012_22680 [Paraclostridium bifermentans]
MMNVNLFGEVYICGDTDTDGLYLVDAKANALLYRQVDNSKSVIAYPVFLEEQDTPQMIYETPNKKKYKKLVDLKTFLDENKKHEDFSGDTYRFLLHRRWNNIEDSSFRDHIFKDFIMGSKLGWYDKFPMFTNMSKEIREREHINRLFAGLVAESTLMLGEDFVKIVVDRPYECSDRRVVIKRKPEEYLNILSRFVGNKNEDECLTSIKFKTKDINEIFELCQKIELINDYYHSSTYIDDILIKAEFAKKLIDTESYRTPMMAHRILVVLALVMHRADLINRSKTIRDIVANILTGNKMYFGEYIDYIDETLGASSLDYLKGVYKNSEYRVVT